MSKLRGQNFAAWKILEREQKLTMASDKTPFRAGHHAASSAQPAQRFT